MRKQGKQLEIRTHVYLDEYTVASMEVLGDHFGRADLSSYLRAGIKVLIEKYGITTEQIEAKRLALRKELGIE